MDMQTLHLLAGPRYLFLRKHRWSQVLKIGSNFIVDLTIFRAVAIHSLGTAISRRVGAHLVRNLAMQADVICQSMIEDKLGLVLNTKDRGGRIRDTERHLA